MRQKYKYKVGDRVEYLIEKDDNHLITKGTIREVQKNFAGFNPYMIDNITGGIYINSQAIAEKDIIRVL